ncbi:hypothetical protein L2E82_14384 [Cichorium intybus]|uniref:Uncharacterized protein n=1 Tax=Cichorium intybus TaxID=13427 RepID=A0ACB9EZX3_CICIN|nr:hypothetical protein L2E82_14384 [Cichorium intybus]
MVYPTMKLRNSCRSTAKTNWKTHEGQSIIRLILDQFNDTLIRILLAIVLTLHAKELVPGDNVELRVGDKILADMRVLNLVSSTLRVEQCSLSEKVKQLVKPQNLLLKTVIYTGTKLQ